MQNIIRQRVEMIKNSKSKNKSEFARKINMDQTTVNNQLLGKRSISIDLIYNILNSFDDISAEWLLRGKGNMLNTDSVINNSGIEDLKAEINQLRGENRILREQAGLGERKANGKSA